LSEVGSAPFPHATPITINAATAMIAANPLIPIAIANSFLYIAICRPVPTGWL
jgi:hypothetical protein